MNNPLCNDARNDAVEPNAAVPTALVRDLVNGLVHALPAIALGSPRLPDARSRAQDFARAFAARRAA